LQGSVGDAPTSAHKITYLNQLVQADTTVPNLQIPEDWNLYTYKRDNPVNYTDPTGYDPLSRGYLEGISVAEMNGLGTGDISSGTIHSMLVLLICLFGI